MLGKLAARFIDWLKLSRDASLPGSNDGDCDPGLRPGGTLGGNGFLAVYIAGLILGNSNFIHQRA